MIFLLIFTDFLTPFPNLFIDMSKFLDTGIFLVYSDLKSAVSLSMIFFHGLVYFICANVLLQNT